MTLAPRRVDTVVLTEHTEFAALVRDILRGGGGVGSLPGDARPLDWIRRALTELAGSPYGDLLTRGVAACLTAPEPAVQAQALMFFQVQPGAAGGERINDLVADERSRFSGVPDPIHPGTDLAWQLLAALASRVALGDARAAELARGSALRPGEAAPVIAELVAADPDWVVAHAEAIVRATPAAGATILIQLQGTGRELGDLGDQIAPLCRADDRFELDIARFIDDPEIRQQLLDAFHAAQP